MWRLWTLTKAIGFQNVHCAAGFDIITKAIQAKSQKELLVLTSFKSDFLHLLQVIIGVLTFVLSSVLNNLTVVIVMVGAHEELSLILTGPKDRRFLCSRSS